MIFSVFIIVVSVVEYKARNAFETQTWTIPSVESERKADPEADLLARMVAISRVASQWAALEAKK
jgi:hypothetical protein